MYIALIFILSVVLTVSYSLTYEELSQQTFDYQNYARQNPQDIMQVIQNKLQYFNGKLLSEPGKIPLLTNEGNASYIDAINFLANQQPVNSLTLTLPLSLAALDHVNDQGPVGAVGHEGTQGETPFQRMDRYMVSAPSAENIAYGITDPLDVIVGFIVDDGVPERSHRAVVYSTLYEDGGVACGCHTTWVCECDLTYAAFCTPLSQNLPSMAVSNNTVVEVVTECVATRVPGFGSDDGTSPASTQGGQNVYSKAAMISLATSYFVYYFLFEC